MAKLHGLKISVVVDRTLSAIRSQWRLFAIAIVLDASPQIALGFAPGDTTRVSAFFSLLTLYLQLLLTIRTTSLTINQPTGYSADRWTEGRYPGAFLLTLLTMLGIIAGLALLVLPGLALFALWCLALPALVAERLGVLEAMRRSWQLVRPHLAQIVIICLVWLIGCAVVVGALGLAAYLSDESSPMFILLDVALDLLISVILLTSPILWAVLYGLVSGRANTSPA